MKQFLAISCCFWGRARIPVSRASLHIVLFTSFIWATCASTLACFFFCSCQRAEDALVFFFFFSLLDLFCLFNLHIWFWANTRWYLHWAQEPSSVFVFNKHLTAKNIFPYMEYLLDSGFMLHPQQRTVMEIFLSNNSASLQVASTCLLRSLPLTYTVDKIDFRLGKVSQWKDFQNCLLQLLRMRRAKSH